MRDLSIIYIRSTSDIQAQPARRDRRTTTETPRSTVERSRRGCACSILHRYPAVVAASRRANQALPGRGAVVLSAATVFAARGPPGAGEQRSLPRYAMTPPLEPVLAHLSRRRGAAIERWKDLLRIPSIGADPAHDGDTRRAASW